MSVDPEVLKKLGKEGEEKPEYQFLGLHWDLTKDEIRPAVKFNLGKKIKGIASDTGDLMGVSQSEFDKIDSSSLLWSVSRRVISRVCAQAYDRLGVFLTPLKIGLKTLTSRAAEIMSNTELDLPMAGKDVEFARQVTNYWRNLPKVKDIKPFPRAVIPEGSN